MTWTTGRPSAPLTDAPHTDVPGQGVRATAVRATELRRAAARNALRAGVGVAVLASGALLLTACSSGSSGAKSSGPASGSASASASASGKSAGVNSQSMDKYRECLSQHGLKLPTFERRSPGASGAPGGGNGGYRGGQGGSGRPSGGFGGGGGFPGFGGASPDAATQKALDACKALQPQFTGRGGGGGADSSAFQAFTSCLKDHGVVLPTPSAGATNGRGGAGGFGGFRGFDTSDPKTAKAYDTCKALLPQRPSGAPGAGATTPPATT